MLIGKLTSEGYMNTLNSKNPNFAGDSADMRKNTVCMIDTSGRLCFVPFGTMTWFFESRKLDMSFPRWFNMLQAKELR